MSPPQDLKAVSRKFPDRVHCEDRLVHAEEREYLMRAADFVLVPSRFEPCGLVDIEFGWRGALCVGFDQVGVLFIRYTESDGEFVRYTESWLNFWHVKPNVVRFCNSSYRILAEF